jgi:uncharacterized RmlC-like cupin family protein
MSNPNVSPGIVSVVHSQESYDVKRGLVCFPGISAQSVGAQSLCLQLLMFPAAGAAGVRHYEEAETAMFVLSGEVEMWYGANMQEHLVAGSGDFIYIPAAVPYMPINRNRDHGGPSVVLLARTSPNERETTLSLSQLEALLTS